MDDLEWPGASVKVSIDTLPIHRVRFESEGLEVGRLQVRVRSSLGASSPGRIRVRRWPCGPKQGGVPSASSPPQNRPNSRGEGGVSNPRWYE